MRRVFRALLFLCAVLPCRAALAQTWTGGGPSANWTWPANWSTGAVPINDGTADIFMDGNRLTTPGVSQPTSMHQLTFNAGAATFTIGPRQPYPEYSIAVGAGGIINNSSSLQLIDTFVNLLAPQTWSAAAGEIVTRNQINNNGYDLTVTGNSDIGIYAGMHGNGGLTINLAEGAKLTFAGQTQIRNDYRGMTTLNSGSLHLQNLYYPGVPGPLTIGDGIGSDVVYADSDGQLSGYGEITINNSGTLDMGTHFSFTGGIIMNGGKITGTGTLRIQEPFIVNAPSTVTTNIDISSSLVTKFDVARGQAPIDLDIAGNILAENKLTKVGAGILQLRGTFGSMYAWQTPAPLWVDEGTVNLAHEGGPMFDGGSIVIGDGAIDDGKGERRLNLLLPNQLNNTTLRIEYAGTLDGGNQPSSLGPLTLHGGKIINANLTLNADVATQPHFVRSTIAGDINFASAARTFDVANGPAVIDLDVPATLSNGALVKTGTGAMRLSGPNTLVQFTLNDGAVIAEHRSLLTGLIKINGGSLIMESEDLPAVTGRIRAGNISTTPTAGFALGSMSNSNGSGGAIYDNFAGISGLDGDEVLLRYTRLGDLNLDGNVTIADFITLAAHYNTLQDATWDIGDVNYDGAVTVSDFIDLASNFGGSISGQSVPISAQDKLLLSEFAVSAGVPVPEPSFALAGVALSLALRRRRAP